MSYSAIRPEPPHNNRYSYQSGGCLGFILAISLGALMLGFSTLSHASPGADMDPRLLTGSQHAGSGEEA
jgi:hypothetical protein